ncbi:MAG: hypothetical protein LBR90_00735 [Elusimicrobiota bacterium]|jgi:hypothetical protein|nr:hypothetical protein [Elusimicrobiota bacterium]
MNNERNIIALVLGLLAAGLLWQYYLKPKYLIKTEDPQTMAELYRADVDALYEILMEVGGELVARSDYQYEEGVVYEDGSTNKKDVLSTRSKEEQDFDFSSSANKPLSLQEQAALGDKRRVTQIMLEEGDIIVNPRMESAAPLNPAEDGGQERFSIFIAPVKHEVIKTAGRYEEFKKQNRGIYPKVDFGKNVIIVLESDGRLSNGYFQVAAVRITDTAIEIDYRVSIVGADERAAQAAFTVAPKSSKDVVLKQIR